LLVIDIDDLTTRKHKNYINWYVGYYRIRSLGYDRAENFVLCQCGWDVQKYARKTSEK
jgi:hypothetical protein